MNKRMVAAVLLLFGYFTVYAQGLIFVARPALNPDGSQVYFSYEGAIYRVPTTGGEALKVVSMGGNESNPQVSPDGKYLAFSSSVQGNSNVYVVEAKGGEVRQLTFHEAYDAPIGWRADSKAVYFESNRYNNISAYEVSVEGGTPRRLFEGYFNTIANLCQNPVTGEFYFNESTESYRFATRKGYKGDHNPDIKSWNPKTKEYRELTSYRGKDIWPMVGKNGELYYVSDEQNGEANIVRYSDKKYLTKFNESVQYPSISFDGSTIAFIKGYKLSILSTATGKVSEPKIELVDNPIVNDMSVKLGNLNDAAVSPDGKKLAFSFRGMLFVSDAKGSFVRQLNTPVRERVLDVVWGKDSNTLYYIRTHTSGWKGLFKQAADGSGSETAIYTPEETVQSITMSPQGDKLVFISGRKSLMMLDVASGKVDKLVNNEFWAFQRYPISFSPDGKYVAYSAVDLFERDIFLYSFDSKKAINLTNSATYEDTPVFSPDGKYLYIAANRFASSFPRGASTQLYKVALDKLSAPFESDEHDKLFTGKAATTDSAVAVNHLESIQRRYTRVVSSGSQATPYVFTSKDKSYLLYSSSHEGEWAVYVTELKDWDAKPAKKISGVKSVWFYTSNGKDLFIKDRDDLFKVDPAAATATKVEIKHSFEKNIRDEFTQMFYEVWAELEQNFYDVSFHGVDWKKKRDYYASFLPMVKSRANLRTLINDMLNELNSSHMGFSSFGSEESPAVRYLTAETGLMFSNDSPYTLNRIVADSKADFSSNPLKEGDELVAVNGVRVDKKQNRERYFSSPVAQKELNLTFSRNGSELSVKLHTMSINDLRSLLYAEWEDANRSRVTKQSKGKVAYVHMRDMGAESLERFLIDMSTDAVHRDALILDLRFNNGGNVHKEVIDYLNQREHFRWSYRDQKQVSHPIVTPANKPIIVLVNERSLSDAEVTSNGIKQLQLAKLVGTETYRWIIFTSSSRLIDGSSVRLPAWGCYTLDGKDLEVEGVSPDVYVKNTFKDRLEQNDPQLDRALKELGF